MIPGENEEDTEVFRQRYLNSLKSRAFGGNKADYIEKVNAIPGVGGVRVYRAWNSDIAPSTLIPPEQVEQWLNGLKNVPPNVELWLQTVFHAGKNSLLTVGGTVKVVIIDSTFSAPSETLVDQVQTVLDPIQNAGEGDGLAPIGHVVKVFPVGTTTVDLSFAMYFQRGWGWEDVRPNAEQAIQEYFTELAHGWADSDEPLIVRVSRVESRLLNVPGILDVAATKLNGKAENLILPMDTIPIVGTVTATAATIAG